MYVGGADVLLKIDVDDYHVIEVGVLERFFLFIIHHFHISKR